MCRPLTVMMLAGFLFLLVLTGGSTAEQPELLNDQQKFNQSFEESGSTSNFSKPAAELYVDGSTSSYSGPADLYKDSMDSDGKCRYQDVLNYLNLTKNKELYAMARPVKNHKSITMVHLQMVIYGILDVREIEQTFVPYIWIYMSWQNEHIWWHPLQFCGIERIVVPTEALWKPDLTIEEMTEKDKAPPIPYLTIRYHGLIELRNDLMLVSTCRMQVFKFPFDIQSCRLSFKSAVYPDEELQFEISNEMMTEWSHKFTQYEWVFISMTVSQNTVANLKYNQSMVVYTIKMRRRSVLYIANFLLPIIFFLCLDFASFLISDSSGEKLGFKVTVLLAVTVMQLILNEILPSSSDRIPLIAVYCIGMFGMMLLSLLETILVMHLMEKDSASHNIEADKDQSLSEGRGDKQGKLNFDDGERKKWTPCACVCDVSADEPPSELLSVAREGNSSKLREESNDLEKVSDELREVILLLNSRKEDGKPGYWTRVAKTINKCFFISYVTVAILFLLVIFSVWNTADDK